MSDYEHLVVRKWLKKLGGSYSPGDSFNVLLRKVLALVGGPEIYRVGDSTGDLLRKILKNLGGSWSPGDVHNRLWRKILDRQPVGETSDSPTPGDSDFALQKKILKRCVGPIVLTSLGGDVIRFSNFSIGSAPNQFMIQLSNDGVTWGDNIGPNSVVMDPEDFTFTLQHLQYIRAIFWDGEQTVGTFSNVVQIV